MPTTVVMAEMVPDPEGAPSGWAFLPSFTVPSEVVGSLTEWVAGQLGSP
jgi:hypothetical protein